MGYKKNVIVGPATSTDEALGRWDGTGGDTLQDSSPTVTDAGEMVNTLQPGFVARTGSDSANATGDGTTYQWGSSAAFTEVIDQNGDFNTNGTFTAPVSGIYALSFQEFTTNYNSGHTTKSNALITSNRTWYEDGPGFAQTNAGGNLILDYSIITEMDAADTYTSTITVSGGTKVIDAKTGSNMAGWLLG